jgi:protein involved in polysaccharide export with SLBB domain
MGIAGFLFNYIGANRSMFAFFAIAVCSINIAAQIGNEVLPKHPSERPRTIAANETEKYNANQFSTADLQKSAGASDKTENPTSVYRIGINDVVRITLKNSIKLTYYFRISVDGTVDLPHAGGLVKLAGKTTLEVERHLFRNAKFLANPEISVEVREYASHIVYIRGLVDHPGGQQIQRDAVPFFVIRAGVRLDPASRRVRITSISERSIEFALNRDDLDSTLIYPGDVVEFI